MAFDRSIPASSIFGTTKSGYAHAHSGPFRCDHCKFYRSGDRCVNKQVMADSQVKKASDGMAIIEDGGCCTYFHPKGKVNAGSDS